MKHHQINWKEINRRANELMERFNVHIDVTRPLSYYSTAIQQMVSIARAVDIDAKVLILDEPTSSLDENEVKQLFAVMRSLKEQGIGIIFITHFLDQVFEMSDRLTILRNGHLVGVYDIHEISKLELVHGNDRQGHERDLQPQARHRRRGRAHHAQGRASRRSGQGGRRSLQIRKGEMIRLCRSARLRPHGDGGDDLLRRPPHKGTLEMNGETLKARNPLDSINRKMAFCPRTGKRDGIIGDLSIRENINPRHAGQARLPASHQPQGAIGDR